MAQKNKSGVSPAGKLAWACLSKPSTKFKKDGEYSVKLVLDAATAKTLTDALRPQAEEARDTIISQEKDAKKAALLKRYTLAVPGVPELDDAAQETGNVVYSFRQTALIRPKDTSKEPFEVKIGVFDAKGKPLPSGLMIGRGTVAKVAYEVVPYKMASDATSGKIGVSLRLKAVQIIELVKYDNKSADAYGFGAEEGYSHEDGETPAETSSDETPGTPAVAGKADF